MRAENLRSQPAIDTIAVTPPSMGCKWVSVPLVPQLRPQNKEDHRRHHRCSGHCNHKSIAYGVR